VKYTEQKEKKVVFVLKEEVDIVGVFCSEESALKCAKELDLFNWHISEHTLFD